MKNVGVVFGGVTCEHDVSVITGIQLIENINKNKYNVIPIYIHSDGEWYTGQELLDMTLYKNFEEKKSVLKKGVILPNKPELMIEGTGIFGKTSYVKLDVVIPAMHGMNGEDGTLQGLLELANIPYTSSGVLGASIGMDKIIMKNIFEANNIPVLPYTYFLRGEWEKDRDRIISKVEDTLEYPMFVKPSNLGSSIGISKVREREGLITAIEVAASYDERIIVEKAVENVVEVNCSAIGRADNVKVSVCERPINWAEFLTFEDKYLNGGKNNKLASAGTKSLDVNGSDLNGMSRMSREVPANILDEQTADIRDYTKKAFKVLCAKGVVRVDFIIDKSDEKVYINEINTIPGSMAFYLWNFKGELSYSELIDEIIKIAEEEHEEKLKNNYTYNSNIINANENAVAGTKSGKLG